MSGWEKKEKRIKFLINIKNTVQEEVGLVDIGALIILMLHMVKSEGLSTSKSHGEFWSIIIFLSGVSV